QVVVGPDNPPADPGGAEPSGAGTASKVPEKPADAGKQEEYDDLLRTALNSIADRKYTDALPILKAAQRVQDTEQIRREIDRVTALITQKQTADKTVQEIQTVLKEGNANDASRLASAGLQNLGGSDEAERLAPLKQQAAALEAVGIDDRQARLARF